MYDIINSRNGRRWVIRCVHDLDHVPKCISCHTIRVIIIFIKQDIKFFLRVIFRFPSPTALYAVEATFAIILLFTCVFYSAQG